MKAVIICLAAAALAQCANEIDTANVDSRYPTTPIVQIGVMAGRDGAAFGPGISCQFNWKQFGLYGFAGTSTVNGYEAQGAKANFSDRTLGFGLAYRAIRLRRFTFGAFGQAAYYGSKVRASYFDPDYQVTVEYRESDRYPLVTIGPEIDFRIAKGVTLVVRPGKDFGNSFAATTAGGFSITGGVYVDAKTIARGTAQGCRRIGKLFQ